MDNDNLVSMTCPKCLTVYMPRLYRTSGEEKPRLDTSCPVCGKASTEATEPTKRHLAD